MSNNDRNPESNHPFSNASREDFENYEATCGSIVIKFSDAGYAIGGNVKASLPIIQYAIIRLAECYGLNFFTPDEQDFFDMTDSTPASTPDIEDFNEFLKRIASLGDDDKFRH